MQYSPNHHMTKENTYMDFRQFFLFTLWEPLFYYCLFKFRARGKKTRRKNCFMLKFMFFFRRSLFTYDILTFDTSHKCEVDFFYGQ